MINRIRLLPTVIFASVLVLSVRVVDFDSLFESENSDQAEEANVNRTTVLPKLEVSTAPAKAQSELDSAAPFLEGGDDLPEGMVPSELVDEEDFDFGDISGMSNGEIRLLHDLANRRKLLLQREESLAEREGLLKVAETQLAKKQDQLQAIRTQIEDLLAQYDTAQDEDLIKLRAIYQNMKPKSAARIFNEMDMETLTGVLRGMPARKVAPIIAAMTPQKARDLTIELSAKEELPDIQ